MGSGNPFKASTRPPLKCPGLLTQAPHCLTNKIHFFRKPSKFDHFWSNMQHKIKFLMQIQFSGPFWSFQPMSFSPKQKRQFHHFISNKNPTSTLSFGNAVACVTRSTGLAKEYRQGIKLRRISERFESRILGYKPLVTSIIWKFKSGSLGHHSSAQNQLAPSAKQSWTIPLGKR